MAPDQVLACTNRLLVDLEPDLLVACLYAHIDLTHGRLTLAGAGHVPPLLREGPGRGRILDIEPGPLLGIGTDVRYPITAAALPPGAILALYTDGLVERPGQDASRATSDLLRHFSTTDDRDLEQLADGLVHHAWPTGQCTDDVTMLLLRAAQLPGRT
ncbi:PP2C family protein-serine/threonine phosphatase [Streptomyces collinus]|uniref:PP2C family protein-serine/threonine phosphatase n=1 Tax=Streptomyces collinus TaxID=42684 RepID=UPI0039807A15